MKESRRFDIALLLAFCLAAFMLRTVFSFQQVLLDDGVNFLGADPWYHMRLIDFLVANFPERLTWDAFLSYPKGQAVEVAPLLDLLVAGLSLVVSLGAPSPRTVELVAAFVPPVLGALVPLPLYGIALPLFGRRVALLAAGIVACQSGPFFERTLLGFVDHHALEALLSVVVLWATLRAERKVGVSSPIIAGLALGAYLLSWSGGSMLVAILCVGFAINTIAAIRRGAPTRRIANTAAIMASVACSALLVYDLALPRLHLNLAALALLALVPTMFHVSWQRWPQLGLRAPAAMVLVAVATATLLFPNLYIDVVHYLGRFAPGANTQAIIEARPLLQLGQELSGVPAYIVYGPNILMGLLALVILGWRLWRHQAATHALVVAWGVGMYVATLAQNRFGYYLGPCVALLSAIICDKIVSLTSPGRRRKPSGTTGRFDRGLAWVVVFVLSFYPGAHTAVVTATRTHGPSAAWRQALGWLRTHSPEPFETADAYLSPEVEVGDGGATPYTVMNWWDDGYYILRQGRRMPVSNPSQAGARRAANFYLSENETKAKSIMLRRKARYVVTDASWIPFGDTPTKFYGIASWGRVPAYRYVETVLTKTSAGRMEPTLIYYPAFYRSSFVQLHLFDGQPYEPSSVWLVEFNNALARANTKRIVFAKQFSSEADAFAYRDAQEESDLHIVGFDPHQSCVFLDGMPSFEPVFASTERWHGDVAAVRVFRLSDGP